MAKIERFARQGIDVIAQRLGLRPKRFPTKESALNASIEKFLNGNNFSGGILDLPQEEEKKGQLPAGN